MFTTSFCTARLVVDGSVAIIGAKVNGNFSEAVKIHEIHTKR